jgi:hypothetical protein
MVPVLLLIRIIFLFLCGLFLLVDFAAIGFKVHIKLVPFYKDILKMA